MVTAGFENFWKGGPELITSVVTSKPAIGGRVKTAQRGAVRDYVVLPCLLPFWQAGLGSRASRAALQQMSMVKEAVKHGADRRRIPQQLAPVIYRTIRSHHRAGSFVAAHNMFEQFFGGGQGELAHAEVINNGQRDGGQRFQTFFAGAVERGVGDLFQEGVSFAVEDAIPLLDDGWPGAQKQLF